MPKKKTDKKTTKTKKNKKSDSSEITASDVRISSKKTPTLLRGMKDILPKDEFYWKKMRKTADSITEAYRYSYLETPILEDASLFIRSVGRGTDIVDKEMYIFEDKDGGKVGLRPEATASVARSFIGHGMHTLPQPIKIWYWGPMFRHDRPQAGRYREFHQFGCENFGLKDPVVDSELISVAYNFLKDLGLDSTVNINSIGSLEDRQNYLVELVGYLRSKRSYLCDDCKARINKNPLRVLDCKQEDCQEVVNEAPQIIDWLSDDSKNHFMKVLEYLDELEIPYILNSKLVRGLDYYTETVFELIDDYEEKDEEGKVKKNQTVLAGGGRYDYLVDELGGPDTPACGFAVGLERVANSLKRKVDVGEIKKEEQDPKIFFAQLGVQARMKALSIVEKLRKEKIIVGHNLAKPSLKSQLDLANKAGAAYTLILGQKEVQDDTVIIRDMESGIQEIVDQNKLVKEIEKKLKKL